MPNFTEVVITKYRAYIATFFLLPASAILNTYHAFRNRVVFALNSAPGKHDEKVELVRKQILNWIEDGSQEKLCTARSPWKTMSEMVPSYKSSYRNIRVPLYDILEVSTDKRTVRVEPLVNMGQITANLNRKGWTLPVIPELDDLTVGGLIMGFGIEGSSHKYGLFQSICKSFDIITAEGKLVHCSKEENTELFYSIPWSHGTLGFLVMAELMIVPSKKYVELKYSAFHNLEEFTIAFEKESRKLDNDFVEALTYSIDKMVLMTGKMTNKVGDKGKENQIGHWYKKWFYKHVQEKLAQSQDSYEYIPLRHYYHRHTRSLFWEMSEIIHFANNTWFRFFLGWALPPRISLMKKLQTETIQKLREKKHVVQDMLLPIIHLKKALIYFEENYKVHPLWLCPMAIFKTPGGTGFLQPARLEDGKLDEMYVDIGAYGTSKLKDFDGKKALRDLESFVIENNGYQALYARSLMSEDQFYKMFDHSSYNKLRDSIPYTSKAFDTVYQKVILGRTEPFKMNKRNS